MAAEAKTLENRMSAEEIAAIAHDDLTPGMKRPGEDVRHREGILSAWDGADLFWQSWEPRDREVRGAVALMHGFGEHSARYHHLATFLTRAGYAVAAIDARGHGRSSGARGHVDVFEAFPRDLDRLVSEVEKLWPDSYMVGFGHSNGGLISLHHALMVPGRLAAYAITSPFLGFQVKVPAPKAAAGHLMSRIWPSLALPTELDPGVLCCDERIVRQYSEDPLVLRVASARWFTETKRAHREILERASRIRAPFLWLVSGADELADARAAESVYHALGSPERELELFPDLKHEVMNEAVWPELARKLVDWYERFR